LSQGPLQSQRYTVEEFLAIDDRSEEQLEYHDGCIRQMSGASPEHELICMNIGRHIGNLLGDRSPCRAYGSNTRLWIASKRRIVHPDVNVLFDPIERATHSPTMVMNPTLLVEVLSPDSGLYDMGEKLDLYTAIDSLRAVVYAAQDTPHLRLLRRAAPKDDWSMTYAAGLESTLHVAALNITLALADVYRGVTFPPPVKRPQFD
jgi:Uma2 family endonuclease